MQNSAFLCVLEWPGDIGLFQQTNHCMQNIDSKARLVVNQLQDVNLRKSIQNFPGRSLVLNLAPMLEENETCYISEQDSAQPCHSLW